MTGILAEAEMMSLRARCLWVPFYIRTRGGRMYPRETHNGRCVQRTDAGLRCPTHTRRPRQRLPRRRCTDLECTTTEHMGVDPREKGNISPKMWSGEDVPLKVSACYVHRCIQCSNLPNSGLACIIKLGQSQVVDIPQHRHSDSDLP